ncbi:nitrogen regulatory IIA protein [Zunongwangia pacifica]|uniref:Nitrogen regulatory IIA protein n=1 Tax=Zunongwangia pacifica TaxID=2911062 RepID=A0A9X1ZMU2_9FLAO|nr:nitrogen regulatory IIA protein [Zunongwangia pacifica]MCL6216906.1 nitrogen regulatory IIA protein [Zunongwangia pacifica]
MKNPRKRISDWLDKLDGQWQAMPVKRQNRYALLFFAGYALLSIIVITEVCYEVGKPNNGMTIEHIENPVIQQRKSPVIPQDSISEIIKNKLYER